MITGSSDDYLMRKFPRIPRVVTLIYECMSACAIDVSDHYYRHCDTAIVSIPVRMSTHTSLESDSGVSHEVPALQSSGPVGLELNGPDAMQARINELNSQLEEKDHELALATLMVHGYRGLCLIMLKSYKELLTVCGYPPGDMENLPLSTGLTFDEIQSGSGSREGAGIVEPETSG